MTGQSMRYRRTAIAITAADADAARHLLATLLSRPIRFRLKPAATPEEELPLEGAPRPPFTF